MQKLCVEGQGFGRFILRLHLPVHLNALGSKGKTGEGGFPVEFLEATGGGYGLCFP